MSKTTDDNLALQMRNELEAYWLPFTPNKQFKDQPRLVKSAEGCYYTGIDGRRIFDGLSGLWCCVAGHGRVQISKAVSKQIAELDYSPAFQLGHMKSFELADRIKQMTPADLDYVFFSNSGSEAVDTAVKMAQGYWHVMGKPGKTRVIGRNKGYHGVNIGGTNVGGIEANRRLFVKPEETEHLPHTLLSENAFSRGIPKYGIERADALEDLLTSSNAATVAAVIVEPFSGSAGVIIPPMGYLQRLREICDRHEVLLIFDEVITGFGRTGELFGANTFNVVPDIMVLAKALTNGTVPMGATVARRHIYQAFMDQDLPRHRIEFPHGYTYSAHPVACAAALASLALYEQEELYKRVNDIAAYFEDAIHSLKDARHVVDIRNIGLAGAIQIKQRDGDPVIRPYEVFLKCWDAGVYVRCGGDTIQLAPAFIVERNEIDMLIDTLRDVIQAIQ